LQYFRTIGLRRELPQVPDRKRLANSIVGCKGSQRAAPQQTFHNSSPMGEALRRKSSTRRGTADVYGQFMGQHYECYLLLDKASRCCNSQEDCELFLVKKLN